MEHKAGFVNIIGSPNVGKSTLMNALVGENLSVITAKAQTTRHRILGILNAEDYQIVFSDTPGLLEPKYELQAAMMKEVETAMQDADIFLLVTEIGEPPENITVLDRLTESGLPLIVLLNKIDLSDQEKVAVFLETWQNKLPGATILPISALHGFNMDSVKQLILERLPFSPPYYDKEELTDRNERFFVSEIIRANIMQQYRKEVPYSVEVGVEEFVDEPDILRIRAIVYVARESQKIILIGEGGKAVKRLGTNSRKELEKFFQKHIFLDLQVRVSKDWREDKLKLKRFGYQV